MTNFTKLPILSIAAAMISIFLIGCTTPYRSVQGPTGTPLVFRNNSLKTMSAHIYENSTACTNRQTLMPIIRPSETRTIAVQANQEVTFTVGQDVLFKPTYRGIAVKSCIVTLTFQAEREKRYQFEFNSSNDVCTYQLNEVTAVGNPLRPIPFTQRTWIRALSEAGAFCNPRS